MTLLPPAVKHPVAPTQDGLCWKLWQVKCSHQSGPGNQLPLGARSNGCITAFPKYYSTWMSLSSKFKQMTEKKVSATVCDITWDVKGSLSGQKSGCTPLGWAQGQWWKPGLSVVEVMCISWSQELITQEHGLWGSPPSTVENLNYQFNLLRNASELVKLTSGCVCRDISWDRLWGLWSSQWWHSLLDSKSTWTARRWKCQWWGLAESSRLLKSGVHLKGGSGERRRTRRGRMLQGSTYGK